MQERCKALELELARVAAERKTLCTCWTQITHFSAQAVTPHPPPPMASKQHPTHETHPNIQFWDRSDFLQWTETPAVNAKVRGWLPYLETENGDTLDKPTVSTIRKLLHGGWRKLLLCGAAPKKWEEATPDAIMSIKNLIEAAYPLFTFTNNGWKLEHLITTHYPSWARRHVNHQGEALEDKSDDNAGDEPTDSNDKDKWGNKHKYSNACCTPATKRVRKVRSINCLADIINTVQQDGTP